MTDMHTMTQAWALFQKRAGVSFNNPVLLETAFTHRSFVNESRRAGEHNERLEFLGDAVLEIVVTDYLFRAYPQAPEGELTAYRAALVNANTLALVATQLGMNDCLLLSKGEARDTGRARTTILANAFEAVVGALYIDQGLESARRFIDTHIIQHASDVIASGMWKDAKSAYQEHAQAIHGVTPHYEVVSAAGPDHDKEFVVALMVGDQEMARGLGKSKQEAEQQAALAALSKKD